MRKLHLPVLICVLILSVVSSAVGALDIQSEILEPARRHLGSGYCRGGISSPCFDCSGFVTHIYQRHLPDLPRISRDMARFGRAVELDDLQPGDLLFFATSGRADRVTHVAIYIGQDSIIHAISDGPNRGVSLTPLSARYWRTRFHSARRVLTGAVERVSSEAEEIEFSRGTYTGDTRNGEPYGMGTMRMSNGDRYEGAFVEGRFHGNGVYLWVSGERYEGEFHDGEMHGRGTYVAADGTTVTGRWSEGSYVRASDTSNSTETAAETVSRDTYLDSRDSPWETWDGIVAGDFYAWQEQEEQAFQEWRRNN